MIAVLGFATIIIFLYVTMTKKLSIQSALIGIPVIAAIIGGFGFDIGKMMIAGVIKVTPSAMIPIFAVNRILKLVKGDPVKITIGAAVLAMLVSLDGDGTTTFIISVSAMLPITTKLKMNPLILPFAVGMAAGPLPWSGPTTRVMAVLHADSSAIFTPIVPAMAVGIAWVLFACYYVGKKERKRLGVMHIDEHTFDGLGEDQSAKRPQLFWFNCILTVAAFLV